jgi:hypothetical protein
MKESTKSTDLDAFVNRAASRLFRYDCPDSMELGEYHLGLVTEPRRGWIRDHIAACPLCTFDLAGLKAFMAQTEVAERPAAQPGILDKIQWLIADLLQPPQTGLAFAVRGSDDALRSYHAGDYEINVEVSADTAHPGHRQIIGLILGVLDVQMTIGLALPGEVDALTTVPLDDTGNFIIADVTPGTYDLIIRPADGSANIRVPNLDIPM